MSAQILRDIAAVNAKIKVLADTNNLHLEGFQILRDSIKALEKRVLALESAKPSETRCQTLSPQSKSRKG